MNRDMMARLNQMQESLAKAQEEMETRIATGTAGGGVVKVEITGAYKVQSIKIDPEAVDPSDVGMLEDLILAATNEALEQVQGFHGENLAGLTGGMDLGALGIPGLGGGGGDAGGGGSMPSNRAARRANRK
jgi:DNA-binding YbaB/EbfC family protein